MASAERYEAGSNVGPTTATITCPSCGHSAAEEMPVNACIYFYACLGCRTLLRPKPGDCCVFCSNGDRPCPPKLK